MQNQEMGPLKKTFHVIFLSAFFSASVFAAPASFSFTFKTTQGEMHFECPQDWAPIGAGRIRELIETDFFTNIAFFRVLEDFVAQFGISGDPAIAAKWENANLGDEPVLTSNLAGTLSFATGGPNTRTTQLFINLVDNTKLDAYGFSPVCRMLDSESLAVAKRLYDGYGEGTPDGDGPDQDLITKLGKDYLEKNFPKLDSILSATLKSFH